MKVLMLGSFAWSLINFRGRLIADLRKAGHDVTVCAPDDDPGVRAALARMGVTFRRTPMDRAGANPLSDLVALARYILLIAWLRPDVIIAYAQKPIVLGGIAARLAGKPRLYVLVSGLGHAFRDAAAGPRRLRWAMNRAYRAAVKHARAIFVFNGDDRRALLKNGIIGSDHYVVQVPGAGVDTDRFAASALPAGPPTFLMIARLMRDKGIADFAEAARLVRDHRRDTRFVLVGRAEPANPASIPVAQIERWVDDGLIEHIPETRDVRPYLARSHVFVLPSYHRDGVPRALLEALASGRPVITTDLPDGPEPVEQGVNGQLVPPHDPPALAAAMLTMIADRARLEGMAAAARDSAVARHDVAKVNALLLSIMRLDSPGRPAGPAAPRGERMLAPSEA